MVVRWGKAKKAVVVLAAVPLAGCWTVPGRSCDIMLVTSSPSRVALVVVVVVVLVGSVEVAVAEVVVVVVVSCWVVGRLLWPLPET